MVFLTKQKIQKKILPFTLGLKCYHFNQKEIFTLEDSIKLIQDMLNILKPFWKKS